jgi:hypothetical protein
MPIELALQDAGDVMSKDRMTAPPLCFRQPGKVIPAA